jgi:hypothetical protein
MVLSVEDNRDDGNCILLAESHIDTPALPASAPENVVEAHKYNGLKKQFSKPQRSRALVKLNPELNSATETVKLQERLWEVRAIPSRMTTFKAIGSGIRNF